ncbi:MAG: urease accessory protein UreD [Chromatocurvus sp.]
MTRLADAVTEVEQVAQGDLNHSAGRALADGEVGNRHWRAHIDIDLADTAVGRTVVARSHHSGPLRLQRAFYPEGDGTAHVYLLHPPGGMVVGDALHINISAGPDSGCLVTTPSAGKFYSVGRSTQSQHQAVRLHVAPGAVLEWLPQESLIFSGANACITTIVDVAMDARFCLWDIVALGRAVGDQPFVEGRCEQRLEITRDGRPWFIERNRLDAGSHLLTAPWGISGANTLGTLVANVTLPRDERESLLCAVQARHGPPHRFSLTQKKDLLIGRYLGPSATQGRLGLSTIWAGLRPALLGKTAVEPRIWHT